MDEEIKVFDITEAFGTGAHPREVYLLSIVTVNQTESTQQL